MELIYKIEHWCQKDFLDFHFKNLGYAKFALEIVLDLFGWVPNTDLVVLGRFLTNLFHSHFKLGLYSVPYSIVWRTYWVNIKKLYLAHIKCSGNVSCYHWQLSSVSLKHTVKVALLCPTPCDPMDYILHGILQARILEWVAVPFSRGSSQRRGQTQVCRIAGGFFTSWATRKALKYMLSAQEMLAVFLLIRKELLMWTFSFVLSHLFRL